MTQDPRSRAYPAGAVSLRQQQQEPSRESQCSRAMHPGIKEILRTLAAHGAGAGSAELAFDLVLHEVAEEAREASQSSGAAIAWMRDGEMVCRATTGENAPNLGVRLDIRSGLAGACADTGQIQNCRDTNIDPRVDQEACRQLGVRSMLVAPISMASETLGILQLYSPKPNAFGDTEIRALQPFIQCSIDAWMEAQAGDPGSPDDQPSSYLPGFDISEKRFEHIRETEAEATFAGHQAARRGTKEFTNSILLIAVLAVAITLGLTLGWRWGKQQVLGTARQRLVPNHPIVVATASESPSRTPTSSGSAASDKSYATVPSATAATPSSAIPDDLVISQDGKIIYRSFDRPSNGAAYRPRMRQETRLLRRVDPEYPPAALARHVQGPVVLDVKVLPDGNVSDVVVRSGDPLLTESAVKAVRQWRFQLTDGAIAERQIRVTIKFTLPVSE